MRFGFPSHIPGICYRKSMLLVLLPFKSKAQNEDVWNRPEYNHNLNQSYPDDWQTCEEQKTCLLL